MTRSPLLDPALASIAHQLGQMKAKIAQLERNQRTAQLGLSSVENGTLQFNDVNGSPVLAIGLQPDGTHAVRAPVATPAGQPSDPIVSPGVGGLYVIWDGLMASGSLPLSDMAGVQVHVSQVQVFTPGPATYVGLLPQSGMFGVGSLDPSDTYYVVLLAVNNAGVTGLASNEIPAVPQDPANVI